LSVRQRRLLRKYAHTIGVAYDDALPLLNRALVATYAAASDFQDDPERLAAFLDERRSGPASANPIQSIVRKAWKGVQSRDKLHRHSSCLARAQAQGVKPADFAKWLSNFPGGIKKAAGGWSRSQRLPDARTKLAREKQARTSHFSPGASQ
jgi:truncated hemoglobin YjbI